MHASWLSLDYYHWPTILARYLLLIYIFFRTNHNCGIPLTLALPHSVHIKPAAEFPSSKQCICMKDTWTLLQKSGFETHDTTFNFDSVITWRSHLRCEISQLLLYNCRLYLFVRLPTDSDLVGYWMTFTSDAEMISYRKLSPPFIKPYRELCLTWASAVHERVPFLSNVK